MTLKDDRKENTSKGFWVKEESSLGFYPSRRRSSSPFLKLEELMKIRVCEIALWIKVLAAKPGVLSSSPGPHTVEGEN